MEPERQRERIELTTRSERSATGEESEESKPRHDHEQCAHQREEEHNLGKRSEIDSGSLYEVSTRASVSRQTAKNAMLEENSKTHKMSFVVASFLISLLFAYLAYWSCSIPIEKSKWPSTTGVITSSEITGVRQRTLRITYEFTIDGEKFTQPESLDSFCALQLPKGKNVVIRYNPNRHSDTVREPEVNGATILFGLISAIMLTLVFGGFRGSSWGSKSRRTIALGGAMRNG